jgi:hypothetical protein
MGEGVRVTCRGISDLGVIDELIAQAQFVCFSPIDPAPGPTPAN